MRCIICFKMEDANGVIHHEKHCPDYVANPRPPRKKAGRPVKSS